MMSRLRLTIFAAIFSVTGCGGPKTSEPPTIRLAAASDLQTVLPQLVEAYRAESTSKVVMSFGASGQLAEQIKAGAPFDLFLAANRKFVDDLAVTGLVRRDSVASYAIGSLVLAIHKDAPDLKGLDDLSRPDVRKIAIANPEFAPYGAAARQALRAAGLWDSLQPKIVLAESVRQTLQYVQTGNVEAGLVSKATANVPGLRVVEIDSKLYDPIIQNLGIVQGTKNPDEAERFRTFLLSEKARAIFSKHGFRLPAKVGP